MKFRKNFDEVERKKSELCTILCVLTHLVFSNVLWQFPFVKIHLRSFSLYSVLTEYKSPQPLLTHGTDRNNVHMAIKQEINR